MSIDNKYINLIINLTKIKINKIYIYIYNIYNLPLI